MAPSSGPKDTSGLLTIEHVDIDSIHEDPNNARLHPQHNLDIIESSLRLHGQVEPLVVQRSTKKVIGGNGRLEVMRERLEWKQVAIVTVDCDDAKAMALAVTLNRSAETAQWDPKVLYDQLQSLAGEFDLAEIGWDPEDLVAIAHDAGVTEPGLTDPDDVPEPPTVPVTKPGDLYVLGEHRLLCGDCTNAADVKRVLDGRTPFLMVTDPPYGVDYDPEWRLNAGLNKEWQTRAEGRVNNDQTVDWSPAYKLFPGHVAYVWHADRFAADLVAHLNAAEFEIRTQIIWRKASLVIGRGHYHWQHEPCWYAVRSGDSAKWEGGRKQSTVWDIPNMHRTQGDVDDGKTIHSAQKPVECMARPIRNHGGPEDDVYDPFLGSGTTIIACQQLSRRCFGLEIDPVYCDVIVQRWEAFTGSKAIRHSVP